MHCHMICAGCLCLPNLAHMCTLASSRVCRHHAIGTDLPSLPTLCHSFSPLAPVQEMIGAAQSLSNASLAVPMSSPMSTLANNRACISACMQMSR